MGLTLTKCILMKICNVKAVKSTKCRLESTHCRLKPAIIYIARRSDTPKIENLSTRLKELRRRRNLRQEQVASLIGVDKSTISAYENNSRQPSFDILLCLANYFHVTTDYLLGQTNIRTVNLSGLTEEEAEIIINLVMNMARKNELLSNYDTKRRW